MSEDDTFSEEIPVSAEHESTLFKEVYSCDFKCSSVEELNNSLFDLNLNEEEPSSTPVEILSEFLSTYMSHDYISALYYCKLILLYEPDNEIVQDFYPLILEKLHLNSNESDEFADNEASSCSTKSEHSSEYFSNSSAGTESDSACSSFSDEEEENFTKSSH